MNDASWAVEPVGKIPVKKTKVLVQDIAFYKPIYKLMGEYLDAAIREVKTRATEKLDKLFSKLEDGKFEKDLGDGTKVVIYPRERWVMKDDAIEYLQKMKPKLASRILNRVVVVDDADAIENAVARLFQFAEAPRPVTKADLRGIVSQLRSAIVETYVIDESKVMHEIKEGKITSEWVQNKLFDVSEDYSLTIAKVKDDAEDEVSEVVSKKSKKASGKKKA